MEKKEYLLVSTMNKGVLNINSSKSEPSTVGEEKQSPHLTLRHSYSKDQWSPLNPEGKKKYAREFLIELRSEPLSQRKIENLPDVVMKGIENPKKEPKRRVTPKRNSQQGNKQVQTSLSLIDKLKMAVSKNAKEPSLPEESENEEAELTPKQNRQQEEIKDSSIIHFSLSLNDKVKEEISGNATRPTQLDVVENKDMEDAELLKKVQMLLNKLTPQNYDKLKKKFLKLPINSEHRLREIVNLIFVKAINVPTPEGDDNDDGHQVEQLAKLCKSFIDFLALNAEGNKLITFLQILVDTTLTYYEQSAKQPSGEVNLTNWLTNNREMEKDEWIHINSETMEQNKRKSALRSIKFIVELFKLKVLSPGIIYKCIGHILSIPDEFSLECLCQLFTMIGKELEFGDNSSGSCNPIKPELVEYILKPCFEKMVELSQTTENSEISPRVRLMLKDVVDLRENKWVPRCQNNVPEKIDEISKEVEKEFMEEFMEGVYGEPPLKKNCQSDSSKRVTSDSTGDMNNLTKGVFVFGVGSPTQIDVVPQQHPQSSQPPETQDDANESAHVIGKKDHGARPVLGSLTPQNSVVPQLHLQTSQPMPTSTPPGDANISKGDANNAPVTMLGGGSQTFRIGVGPQLHSLASPARMPGTCDTAKHPIQSKPEMSFGSNYILQGNSPLCQHVLPQNQVTPYNMIGPSLMSRQPPTHGFNRTNPYMPFSHSRQIQTYPNQRPVYNPNQQPFFPASQINSQFYTTPHLLPYQAGQASGNLMRPFLVPPTQQAFSAKPDKVQHNYIKIINPETQESIPMNKENDSNNTSMKITSLGVQAKDIENKENCNKSNNNKIINLETQEKDLENQVGNKSNNNKIINLEPQEKGLENEVNGNKSNNNNIINLEAQKKVLEDKELDRNSNNMKIINLETEKKALDSEENGANINNIKMISLETQKNVFDNKDNYTNSNIASNNVRHTSVRETSQLETSVELLSQGLGSKLNVSNKEDEREMCIESKGQKMCSNESQMNDSLNTFVTFIGDELRGLQNAGGSAIMRQTKRKIQEVIFQAWDAIDNQG